ncbi:hypothetical protein MOQ_003592 [Trypanosoma cruzi marinkellei]|uniref:Uncharacterized protein n=1 Tax=Trypanosoma cruzi marinkellei TaxID=85056 RepID=K2MZU2_TRYCR|nr:hypothetical protein MOQ_003592 [Trypanosoma cruzi marinkellei]
MSPGEVTSLRVLSPLLWRRFASSVPSYSNGLFPVGARSNTFCFAWSTPWHVMRRYASSLPSRPSSPCGSPLPTDATVEDDPVLPFLLPNSTMPLTQLAKLLPDEVLEKLENGLKSHLENFPARYRIFRGTDGLLHAQCVTPAGNNGNKSTKEDKVEETQGKKKVSPSLSIVPGRFLTLESFMRCKYAEVSLGTVDCNPSYEKKEKNIQMMKHFFHWYVYPLKRAELWVLTEEYKLSKFSSAEVAATVTGAEKTTFVDPEMTEAMEGKEVLQGFRWVQLDNKEKLNQALSMLHSEACSDALGNDVGEKRASHGDVSSATTFRRSSTFVRFLVPTAPIPVDAATSSHCIENGIEEYNFYRICRALSTTTFMRLPELQDVVDGWLTQPLAAVLAIAGEESKKTVGLNGVDEKHSLLEFECDPDDSTRIVGVRFWLDEERYLPPQYRSMTPAELEKELSELETITPKDLNQLSNHKRVKIIDRKRLLKRCIALHELGVSPMCHPDVLAYYVFDILPLDGQLILTGHLPKLLPENMRRITEARSRAWLKGYPHLFRLVETPPEVCVQRMEAPAANSNEDDKQDESQKFQGEEQDNATGPLKEVCEYQQRLLDDPEEQLRVVVSVVAARLETCGTRKLLPSHIPKFITSDVRRKIFPRGSGGPKEYLMRYPEVFILTDGIHPHEPVVTLAPKYHPNPRLSSASDTVCATAADANEEGK